MSVGEVTETQVGEWVEIMSEEDRGRQLVVHPSALVQIQSKKAEHQLAKRQSQAESQIGEMHDLFCLSLARVQHEQESST